MTLSATDPLATTVCAAIQQGDVKALGRILVANPQLATERIVGADGCQRSLLHIATDWPGHFPNVALTISVLLGSGAEVDTAFVGSHSETALHWAASSNDIEAVDALLDGGATIDAPGGIIGNGTALDDAVTFAQWRSAYRLVERGARASLWNAAALGLIQVLAQHFAQEPPPSGYEVTNAFWFACHGGHRSSAAYLAERGADVDWIGYDDLTPLDAALRHGNPELVAWLLDNGAGTGAQVRSPRGDEDDD